MLKHTANGYVANKVIRASLPKVKGDEQAAANFEKEFNVSKTGMRLVGAFELIGSIFLILSVFHRTFTRLGTIILNIILGGAIFKHFQAGHGLKGSKTALKLFGLNTISLLETFKKDKK